MSAVITSPSLYYRASTCHQYLQAELQLTAARRLNQTPKRGLSRKSCGSRGFIIVTSQQKLPDVDVEWSGLDKFAFNWFRLSVSGAWNVHVTNALGVVTFHCYKHVP